MVIEWLVEIVKGIGRFFLHPLLYYFMFMSLLMGYIRIKRERFDFHGRIYDIFHEFKSLLTGGLVLSLIFSVMMVGAGLAIPFGSIVLIAVFTILLGAIGRVRFLIPSYVIGLSFFGMILLSQIEGQSGWIGQIFTDLQETSLPAVSMLVSLLLIVEGILIVKKGHVGTSPRLINSKRGLKVGSHVSDKLWLVPLFLLIPGEGIAVFFEWWPVFTMGGEAYSFFLVPFGVGYSQSYKGMLPKEGAHFIGKRTIALGVFLTAVSVASVWYPVVAIMAVAFAMIAREVINFQYKIMDDTKPFLYSKQNDGIFILGIIPHSPAAKMGLQIGEVITKVNGLKVSNEKDFYQSIQKNSAFCKLEVKGLNGEINFAQAALYEGQHHELGILFVPEEKDWSNEAV
ncbi:PDZ domain-containing protein [Bacillus sp. PS06]|nr:PDZ domain-containing protein [Bacillus sp. PS06]